MMNTLAVVKLKIKELTCVVCGIPAQNPMTQQRKVNGVLFFLNTRGNMSEIAEITVSIMANWRQIYNPSCTTHINYVCTENCHLNAKKRQKLDIKKKKCQKFLFFATKKKKLPLQFFFRKNNNVFLAIFSRVRFSQYKRASHKLE